MEYYSALKTKGGDAVICHNMSWPAGYFTVWNKPDTKRKILHHLTYIWYQKKKKGQIFTEIRNKTSYEGQGCGEEMGEVSQKIQNSIYAGWTNLKISLTDNVLYSGFLLNEQVIAALDTGEKMGNCEMIDMFICFTIVNILLFMLSHNIMWLS